MTYLLERIKKCPYISVEDKCWAIDLFSGTNFLGVRINQVITPASSSCSELFTNVVKVDMFRSSTRTDAVYSRIYKGLKQEDLEIVKVTTKFGKPQNNKKWLKLIVFIGICISLYFLIFY